MNQLGENATSSTPAGDQQQRGEAGASDQGRQHGKLVAALAVSSTTTGGSASRWRYALRHREALGCRLHGRPMATAATQVWVATSRPRDALG
jgi:hypothetical protein